MKDAITKEDIEALVEHASPAGTTFMDSAHTYSEITELLNNRESWLSRHLFFGERSVKAYFENTKDLERLSIIGMEAR